MARMIGTALLLVMVAACSRENAPAPRNDSAAPADATAPTTAMPVALSANDPSLGWGACPPIFTAPGCEIAVLNGDPAKPNSDVLLRVPGGYTIPPHRHTSAERMILVSGQFRVQYDGHEAATLNAGNYAYGPAGQAHEASCLGNQPCTLFIAFEGPVDAEPVTEPLSQAS